MFKRLPYEVRRLIYLKGEQVTHMLLLDFPLLKASRKPVIANHGVGLSRVRPPAEHFAGAGEYTRIH